MKNNRKQQRTSLSALAKSFSAIFKGIFFTTSNEDFKRLKNFIC
jgi:hypothetical protein